MGITQAVTGREIDSQHVYPAAPDNPLDRRSVSPALAKTLRLAVDA